MKIDCWVCGRPAENIRKPWGWKPVQGPQDQPCCLSCAASNSFERDNLCPCLSCRQAVKAITGRGRPAR